jgi:hypothetical protein
LDYPYLDKRRALLRLLDKAQDRGRTHGESQLRLEFYNSRADSRLLVSKTVGSEPQQNIAHDLGLRGTEAIGLLNDLGDDGYLRLDYGLGGAHAGAGLIMVRITEKGRAEMNKAIPASQEELWAIKQRLQQHGMHIALNHLNQAESTFDRGEWEAANGQIRACLESVFDTLVSTRLQSTKTGGAARKELEEQGVLKKYEARLVQHFIDVAGGAGSHAGVSNEDEARGRFLAGLGICYIGISLMPPANQSRV